MEQWFFEERTKFIEIQKKQPIPVFIKIPCSDPAQDKLKDAWKMAKVTGTKHPDIATLTFKKIAEDIIDSFDRIEQLEDISQRFGEAWEKIKSEHYFTPYREFEEAFTELLELGCDESLLDYEGREIKGEWIDLAKKIVIGLLASGVIPGKDKHIFLRIPKLEPLSLEGIEGVDKGDETLKQLFKDSKLFPKPQDYKAYIKNKPWPQRAKEELDRRYSKYEKIYTYVKEILHKVAKTNLEVYYALENLRNSNQNRCLDLDLDMDRLPIYEISIPQINETDDIDILIKTLREYIHAVDLIFDKTRYDTDPLYKRCFNQLNKIRIVPLIENPDLMMDLTNFICTFFNRLIELHKDIDKEFKKKYPEVTFTNFTIVDFRENPDNLLRLWLARSDTALNYGNIAAEIARVFALSECEKAKKRLQEQYKDENPPDIRLMYGVGLPTFRGGLNPSDNTVWKHYPVDVTVQGIRFDMSEITVRQFIEKVKLFSFQPYFDANFFEEDQYRSNNAEWHKSLKPEKDWHSELELNDEDSMALKKIMAESICIYWENISKLGTLIRYIDEIMPKIRARLKTAVFSRENPKISSDLFSGVSLSDRQQADEKLRNAMDKLNREWPPDNQPLKLSRAISLNFFLVNCGIPPTLLDLGVFEKIDDRDKELLKRYVPGLSHLIRNDYKLFVLDAAAILLDKPFVEKIMTNTEGMLNALCEWPIPWTEAESNFRDVLLGDVIEHNALLLSAITTYPKLVPVRRVKNSDYDLFIDRLSQMLTDQIDRQIVVNDRLESFSGSYPADISEALKNIDRFKGDQRWIKVIYAGVKMAVERGWMG